MTSTATPDIDPLETYESLPAVSFHEPNGGHPMGKWAKLEVRDWPKLLEQKDDDGNVERWDNGDAKLVLVVPVFEGVDEDGKKVQKNLWAKKMGKGKPHSLFQQLAAAQKKVRKDTGDDSYRLGPGDTLAVKFASEDRSVKATKGNYPKNYEVVIRPGQRPAPEADPFKEEPAAPAQEQASEDPWSEPAQQPKNVGDDPFGAPGQIEDDEPPF